jgi:L,D-transpeptidase YcbB
MISLRTVGAAGAALILAACGRDSSVHSAGDVFRSWNPNAIKEVRGVPVETLRLEIQRELKTKPTPATDDQWMHVNRLYKAYQASPLWLDGDGLIKDRADALVDALVNATTDAIRIDPNALFALAQTLDTLRHTKDPTAAQLARADMLLTTSYAGLAEDYLAGQINPTKVGQSWHIDPQEEEVDSALTRSLRDKDLAAAIGRMRPTDYDYEMLRRKLADLRSVVAAGGWPAVPAGKSLKRGETDSPARLSSLRARLQAEGFQADVPTAAPPKADSPRAEPRAESREPRAVYDASLAAAIAQFQAHHAIVVDSALGKETLDALNVPAQFRLLQIAANLERYRWLPRALGSKYIFVNVPAFRLQGYENGQKTIEMKVIVGADFEGKTTPVFSDSMEYVIFRPYWDVPDKIMENEILPKGVPADFEMTTQNGKPHLRQRPGPKNALGFVKFLFPNDFNIYLHDTPNHTLFEQDIRAFSHGCIRLEKPDELAQWVLGWDAARVHDAMESGPDDRRVNLPKKIPVYIAYFTAYMRDGQLWFGNDLYRRDDQLAEAVAGGAIPSAEAVRAVAALRHLTD